jgi:hypothetical protein
VNDTHSFPVAFAVSCGILLISVASYWFVIGNRTRVRWSTEQAANFEPQLRERAAEA